MAILVTGGTGFVGLNLVEALLARGDSVVILSNGPLPRMAPPVFARLPGQLTLVNGDVRDARLVGDAVRRHAIEQIIHGAAITTDHQREARSPALILEVNLLGLVHILDAARDVTSAMPQAAGPMLRPRYFRRRRNSPVPGRPTNVSFSTSS